MCEFLDERLHHSKTICKRQGKVGVQSVEVQFHEPLNDTLHVGDDFLWHLAGTAPITLTPHCHGQCLPSPSAAPPGL
jgi:hypothetical protein